MPVKTGTERDDTLNMSNVGRVPVSGKGTAIIVALAGIALSLLASNAIYSQRVERRQIEMSNRASGIKTTIGDELAYLVGVARGAAALVANDPDIGATQYAAAVENIVDARRSNVITAINVVEYVPAGAVDDFLRSPRTGPDRDLVIHPANPTVAAGVITLVYPVEPNVRALGFDTYTNPVARAALEQSRVAVVPAMSDGLRIIQEPRDQTSVVVYVPIENLQTGEFLGWISGVIRVQQFLDSLDLPDGALGFRLIDESSDGQRVIGQIPSGTEFAGQPVNVSPMRHFGHTWTAEFFDFRSASRGDARFLALLTLGAGLSITVLTTALVWAVVRREEVARAMVEQRTADLVAVNADLTAANRVKGDFLAVVSHEFRTPLTVIKGSAEMLEEGDVPSDLAADLIQRIGSNAGRLAAMVSDLLVAARLETGKLRLFPTTIPLAAAVDIVTGELGAIADGVENRLQTTDVVHADRFHLERILSNLLSNAYKYGKPPVVISGQRQGDEYQLSIRDHGAGVGEAMKGRLFGAFEQGDQGFNRRSVGVGLGLNIVQRLAQLNGGDVAYRQALPGAEFLVTLPAVLAAKTTDDSHGREVVDDVSGALASQG